MRNRLNKILVIDIEATCWEKDAMPSGMRSEIIEVGMCFINLQGSSDLTIENNEGIIIKPSHSTVSEFCENLTGITQETVDEAGISFESACKYLISVHNSQRYAMASWGDYDRTMFRRECLVRRDIEYPFGRTHWNVKNMFAIFCRLKKEIGLEAALASLDFKFEGRPHAGRDDAYNIAKILRNLLLSHWAGAF